VGLKVGNKKSSKFLLYMWLIIFILVALVYCSYRSSTEVRNPSESKTTLPSEATSSNTKYSSSESPSVKVESNFSRRVQIQTDSRIALEKYLKDPKNAEIRNHKGNCGEVNSKNSFDGYSGFKRFIASPAIVAIEGENMNPEEFQSAWEQICK